MKKILPFLFLIITSCSGVGDVVTAINPFNLGSTGIYPLILIGELETNLSSIFIDKTKAKIDKFSIQPYEILPEDSTIYIMPTVLVQSYNKSFDTYYSKLITNYILMNNFAKPVKNINDADFILRTDITESPEKRKGVNFSTINITIMDQDEIPVFYSVINITSRSDKNFYYYPSKAARPVKELTLYGLEEIFLKSLPQAFYGNREG